MISRPVVVFFTVDPWLVAVNGPVDELPPVVFFAVVWPGFQPFGSNCAVTGIVP